MNIPSTKKRMMTCGKCGYRWMSSRIDWTGEIQGWVFLCAGCEKRNSAARHSYMANKLYLQADVIFKRRRGV